jgi:hypothetical protein
MALRDPVAVYNAANNLQAHFVRDALSDSGVDAFVTEDISQVGTWMGGLVPELHKPQVWVEQADIERAKAVLDQFEARIRELRERDTGEGGIESAIEVVCEECGQRTMFPSAQRGSVQQCQHCRAFVDVGDTGETATERFEEEKTEDGL